MINFLAYLLISLGLFFVAIGVVGLMRFSNIFQRMHALSVMETLGFFCFFLGLMILAGASLLALKLFFIVVLMMIIAPTSTHVLATYARLYEKKSKGEKLSKHL